MKLDVVVAYRTDGDFDKFMRGFSSRETARRAAGATGTHHVWREVDDPSRVHVMLAWTGPKERAVEYIQSAEVEEAVMKAGGVTEPPRVYYLQLAHEKCGDEEVEQGESMMLSIQPQTSGDHHH